MKLLLITLSLLLSIPTNINSKEKEIVVISNDNEYIHYSHSLNLKTSDAQRWLDNHGYSIVSVSYSKKSSPRFGFAERRISSMAYVDRDVIDNMNLLSSVGAELYSNLFRNINEYGIDTYYDAIAILKYSSQKGSDFASINLGSIYMNEESYDNALTYFSKAADNGNEIGKMLFNNAQEYIRNIKLAEEQARQEEAERKFMKELAETATTLATGYLIFAGAANINIQVKRLRAKISNSLNIPYTYSSASSTSGEKDDEPTFRERISEGFEKLQETATEYNNLTAQINSLTYQNVKKTVTIEGSETYLELPTGDTFYARKNEDGTYHCVKSGIYAMLDFGLIPEPDFDSVDAIIYFLLEEEKNYLIRKRDKLF